MIQERCDSCDGAKPLKQILDEENILYMCLDCWEAMLAEAGEIDVSAGKTD